MNDLVNDIIRDCIGDKKEKKVYSLNLPKDLVEKIRKKINIPFSRLIEKLLFKVDDALGEESAP